DAGVQQHGSPVCIATNCLAMNLAVAPPLCQYNQGAGLIARDPVEPCGRDRGFKPSTRTRRLDLVGHGSWRVSLGVMTQLVGAHVGQADPIAYAEQVGANLVQIFLGDPQSWSAPEVVYPGGAPALAAA